MASEKLNNLIFGIVVAIVGLFFLMKNLGWIEWYDINWEVIWPVIVIGFGVHLILKHRK